jgi:bifunctional non-homologous end joining protein LigD
VTVRLTSLDRVVFPATGFTKGELVSYYEAVAPVLLPHLVDRPLTVARFPEGVDGYGWYQTQCRGPEWMRRRTVGTQSYCVIDNLDGLLWLVNAGTVELHPLLSRGDRTDEATELVLDLDPGPPASLAECAEAALALRPLLRERGLEACVKTSGALGLHVYAPLAPAQPFAETKKLARQLAAELVALRPDLAVDRQPRALRRGKVLVDWGQNAATRSLAAPYSVRAGDVPRVSTPVAWDELELDPRALVFEPGEVVERVERAGDLFAPLA